MNTFEETKRIISAVLEIPADSIRSDASSADFAAWDSVHHLIIVMELEKKFGLKFMMDEVGEMNSINRIVSAVTKKTVK